MESPSEPERPAVQANRRRHITPARVLGVLVLMLYLWFRHAASGMEHSSLPAAMARPIPRGAETLMTYQAGEENGRPVIFVHGTPGQADNWAWLLRNPPSGILCIAVDRPGFGASTPAEGYRLLSEEAGALHPLLESLRGRDPILVGHSLGGPIIVQAALDYPDLVGGLVIAAGSLSPSVEKVFAIQYLGDFPGISALVPRPLRNSNRELLPLREDLEKLLPRLPHITCPVTIIHGTDDMLVPFENVAYMEKAFAPGVIHETIVLKGENHFLPWTSQETIWRAVEGLASRRLAIPG